MLVRRHHRRKSLIFHLRNSLYLLYSTVIHCHLHISVVSPRINNILHRKPTCYLRVLTLANSDSATVGSGTRQYVLNLLLRTSILCMLKSINHYMYIYQSLFFFRYVLKGVTFFNGNHYRAAIYVREGWIYYDGLWERQQPGSGLRYETRKTVPQGFILSSCIYIKASLVQ